MKNQITIVIIFLSGLQLGFAQNSNYKESIDSLLNYFKENNAFSGKVVIKKNNEVLYSADYNIFSEGKEQYKIGSITKIFTSILVFQLIEEGKLKFDTPLSNYFPSIKHSDKITIENMLSHTSGIFDIILWDNYYSTRDQKFTRQQILEIINNHKPEFRPDKDCDYSNSNYILLGYIIEDITKESYAKNVKDRIVDKIGLENTYAEESEKNISSQKSYYFDGGGWIEDISSDPSLPFAAGAIISTNEDLCKLMNELFNGKLISDHSLQQMKTLRSKAIGYGLFKAPFYDKTGWAHTGRIDEFKAAVVYFPDDSICVSILSDASLLSINDISIGVLSKFFDKKYKYPEFYHSTIQKPAIDVFTGKYKAKLAGIISLGTFQISKAKNNYLFLTENSNDDENAEKALLERINENTFFSRKANAKLIFSINEKGFVDNLTLEQGKVSIKCIKID